MQIGFDAKRAFNNTTGLGNYSRFVLDALLAHHPEHACHAYTPSVRDGLYPHFPTGLLHTPGTLVGGPLWRSYLITRQLKADGIQVFHGLSGELPAGLRRAGIRSVVTIHDVIFLRMPELYKPIDRLIYRRKFHAACRHADAVVAVSEQTRRDILAHHDMAPERVHVVYQDCDARFRHPASAAGREAVRAAYALAKPYLLCVGTIEPRKNQLTLVKAFAELAPPGHELLLVGRRTAYQAVIEAYLARHRIPNVRLLNHVPFGHLPALYQGADVFAYPSFFEGFGIPVVEALHSGVPVVAATGSCLEEAGGPHSLYADPRRPGEWAAQLGRILAEPGLPARMAAAGLGHVRQFAAARIAAQLDALYRSL